MKYIIFDNDGIFTPVIFPNMLVHQDVALALKGILNGATIFSAGDVHFKNPRCHGKSVTLGAVSNPVLDSLIIETNDYSGGIADIQAMLFTKAAMKKAEKEKKDG